MTRPVPGYAHIYSGKVRDIYAPLDAAGRAREDQVLLVASDRISAYDHILETPIPDKGRVLTQLSLWWFERLDGVPNHIIDPAPSDLPADLQGRSVLVRRLEMVPVECIARAYLTGSGLADYERTGAVNGIRLPAGLVDGSKLPAPIFTPTTKAPVGEHDQPMTEREVQDAVGVPLAARLDVLTRRILARGNEIAASRGIIIADTKVEFGIDRSAQDHTGGPVVVLADEVLTPDSSRFWPAAEWEPGRAQSSFDKQFVRDWLTSSASGWDRHSGDAPPALPEAIVEQTRARYLEAYERITGAPLAL